MDWTEYDRQAKATRKLGHGVGHWNTDEGCTVHAVDAHARTACGVFVGRFSQGWLTGSWMQRLDVTCKRCLRVIAAAQKPPQPF